MISNYFNWHDGYFVSGNQFGRLKNISAKYFPNKILIGILEEFRGHLFLPKVNAYSYKMKILQEFFLDKSPFRKASEIYQLVHTNVSYVMEFLA